MSRLLKASVLTGIIAGALQAQAPVVKSILSSASEALPGLPNAPIAEGSVFVIYGSNMGPATLAQAPSVPLPPALGGTTVSFNGGGITAAAPLVYVSAGQIAGILPSNIPAGPATVTVTFNNLSGSLPMTVVTSNFAMLTLNATGAGPAVIQDASNPNLPIVTLTYSAAPNDVVVLYGTGLGPLPNGESDAAPPAAGNINSSLQVFVGGIAVVPSYHGRSYVGLDQINFAVPPGVIGCYVPIYVQSSPTLVSNIGTISVATSRGAPCTDPVNGIPLSGIAPDSNGNYDIGLISLAQTSRTIPPANGFGGGTTISSGATAQFAQFTPAQLAFAGNIINQPSIGGCIVTTANLANSSTSIPTFTGLDAGASLQLRGSLNFTLNESSSQTGYYSSASSISALPIGNYTVTSTGGAQVSPFTTTFGFPQLLTWTNSSVSAVNRSAGQLITWTGGAPNSYVQIMGSSNTGATGVAATFTCIVPVAALSFTIPPAVLLSLPASSSANGLPSGTLSVGNYVTATASGSPSGLSYFYTTAGSTSALLTNYQ